MSIYNLFIPILRLHYMLGDLNIAIFWVLTLRSPNCSKRYINYFPQHFAYLDDLYHTEVSFEYHLPLYTVPLFITPAFMYVLMYAITNLVSHLHGNSGQS